MSDSPEVMVEHYRELTREQILAKPAGRELDEQIDTALFGKEFKDFPYGRMCYNNRGWRLAKPYSTDIATAWELWTHGVPEDWCMNIYYSKGKFVADIIKQNEEDGYKYLAQVESESAPETMVKCRLLAVMGL